MSNRFFPLKRFQENHRVPRRCERMWPALRIAESEANSLMCDHDLKCASTLTTLTPKKKEPTQRVGALFFSRFFGKFGPFYGDEHDGHWEIHEIIRFKFCPSSWWIILLFKKGWWRWWNGEIYNNLLAIVRLIIASSDHLSSAQVVNKMKHGIILTAVYFHPLIEFFDVTVRTYICPPPETRTWGLLRDTQINADVIVITVRLALLGNLLEMSACVGIGK